jgi:exodeoxyribonuclease VII large subunit
MFRTSVRQLRFKPEDGQRVVARGRLSVYEIKGEYQIVCDAIEPDGVGALQLAFEQLKKRLEAEGLFDVARKKPLPMLPRRIGVVTSPRGAAVRDIIRILRRRFPNLHLIVYPVRVQGEGAAEEIAAALKYFSRKQMVDVILLARGGGSIEDLWAFNEEVLARAIAESAMPVVSGVGHETDFTIADFAADVRAPTPTAAAELVSPQRVLLLRDLDHRHASLARGFGRMMERRAQQLDWLARRLVSPAERLERQRTHLRQLAARLASAGARPVRDARARFALVQMRWQRWRPDLGAEREHLMRLAQRLGVSQGRRHERAAARVSELSARLQVLSPQRTLERGYAALIDAQTGRAVRAPNALNPKRPLTVHLAEGAADIVLADVQPRLSDEF